MLRCVLFLLLLLFLLAACARPPAPTWTEVPTADRLLQRIAETTGKVDSLDAAAKVGLTIKGKYRSTQQFLLLEKPDHLRADVLTGFGQLALQMTSDGDELSVFLNTTVPGRFFRGAATDENLARFTRVPLSVNNMVRLLLYDPPQIASQKREVKVVDGQLILRLIADNSEQELLFDHRLRLIGSRYFAQNERFLEVLFLNIDDDDNFPRRIQIELPAEQTKLALDFDELQTSVDIDAARFRLQPPKNLPVEVLP